mmetsp:Transcript_13510/g.22207  ORF Transcript_13510/g.22207 Transcript_13510/m.22207 type:complete len:480 (+) Transcript_13510:80-1519(+)
MSQTQAELKNMVSDLFGDSSDEEDNEVDETSVKVPIPPVVKKPIDEDDLFSSDEEDEVQAPAKKRLGTGVAAKKRDRSGESASTSDAKRSRKGQSGSSSGEVADDIHDSDDEYDSGEEVVKTKEDDDFLDNNEDDQELLREYDKDNETFDDERPDGDVRYHTGGGRSSGSTKKVSGGGGIGMIDPNTTNPFEQTLLALKRKKATDVTDTKKGEIVSDILRAMNEAAEEDKLLYQQNQPAIKKLQMISRMERAVTTKTLQNILLEYDLLIELNKWIEPMSKNVLAALTVRTAVYDVLMKLPVQTDHIKRSKIGKTLMSMVKHKQETPENKRKIRAIVDKWSRPIFGKSTDARAIDIRERLMHETPSERQHRADMIEKNTSKIISETSSRQFELNSGEKEELDDGQSRARLPVSHGLMFTVQPQSRNGGVGDALGRGNSAAKHQKDSSRNSIVKRLKDMKQSSGKKDFRLVTADVGGRDKA